MPLPLEVTGLGMQPLNPTTSPGAAALASPQDPLAVPAFHRLPRPLLGLPPVVLMVSALLSLLSSLGIYGSTSSVHDLSVSALSSMPKVPYSQPVSRRCLSLSLHSRSLRYMTLPKVLRWEEQCGVAQGSEVFTGLRLGQAFTLSGPCACARTSMVRGQGRRLQNSCGRCADSGSSLTPITSSSCRWQGCSQGPWKRDPRQTQLSPPPPHSSEW